MENDNISKRANYIKASIGDLQERVYRMQTFNRSDEISLYFDDIESQILMTVESAVKHLRELEKELLDEINKRRAELIQAASSFANKSLEKEASSQQVKKLQRDVHRLKKECSAYLSQLNPCQDLYENLVSRQTELLDKAKRVNKSIRKSTFGNRFMKFIPNHLFTIPRNYFGKVTFFNEEDPNYEGVNESIINEPCIDTLIGHSKEIKATVCGLDDGLTSCSTDGLIKLWKLKSYHRTLKHSSTPILSLVGLPMFVFFSGDSKGFITAWNARAEKRYFSHKIHDKPITALIRIADDCIVSFSSDDTLKKWSLPSFASRQPVFTCHGHGCTGEFPLIDRLQNGYLVTCSSHKDNSVMKIWDPIDGKMVKEIQTNAGDLTAICALWNDQVVICSAKGLLKIINIVEPSFSRTLVEENGQVPYYCLLELPNGYFATSVSETNPVLQVWDPSREKLVQSLATGHSKRVSSISRTHCSKRLVTASHDSTIKVWKMEAGIIKNSDKIKPKSFF